MIIIIFVFSILTLTGVQENNIEWIEYKSFNGTGSEKTAPFTIDHDIWAIRYYSSADKQVRDFNMPGAHIFTAWLRPVNNTTGNDELVINESGKIKIRGKTYIYRQGQFYFDSNSANGSWYITVLIPKK